MRTTLLILSLPALVCTVFAEAQKPVVLENPLFRYTISTDARNVAFVDRTTASNYLAATVPSPCARVRMAGKEIPATMAEMADGRLTLGFGETGIKAKLKVESQPYGIILTVESINGAEVDSLTFVNVPLTLKGVPSENFGACALSLNLITRVDALPALQSELRASCEKKFGIVGAKVAIVGAPTSKILGRLQETLAGAGELPLCKVAGPWAREIPFNHGSYLFNFGSLVETNVDEWIEMVRSLGFTQIDNHGGGAGFFRFGDMELNRKKWPDGWEAQRRIVDKLHAAGIGSIFHTYAFFIDKQSKYVTPVPDARLDSFRSFTLAEPLSADATEITVNESTANMSTVTGFFEQNSVVLHIGDELVAFGGFSKEAPWKFTGVKRGAHGTKAAAHEQGAKARHLKEMFGLFVPDVQSSLFEEIAANHADVVNRCGFDGLYLDAIDGSSILRGGDEVWYWQDKFVVEIQRRLKKPVGMEMSSMGHHFWQYRTRWQAWDYPQRGHKRFVDQHAEGVNGGLLLPLHLGWWGFQSFNPPQIEPSYPDVMENLGAKLIGWDAGISLTAGVDREALRKTPLFRRAAEILRTCEGLRHANAFDEATKAKLREPGKEFALFKDAADKMQFRRVHSQSQTVDLLEPWTVTWGVTNLFADQPAKFRIEALISVDTYSVKKSNSIPLLEFNRQALAGCKITTAAGVSLELVPQYSGTNPWCLLVATNTGKVPQNAAWARIEKRFDPPINLKNHQALRVYSSINKAGAVAAIRMESPQHVAYGAVADRHINLEVKSCLLYNLIETESSRWSDFVWNDGKGLYNVYRETIHFDTVESVSFWLQNLPPGQEVRAYVGTVLAVPMIAIAVKNPKITFDGTEIEFPIELASGSWIECNGPDDCAVYGAKGESLGKVTPRGTWPTVQAGVNSLSFTCESGDGAKPRTKITVFAQGEPL